MRLPLIICLVLAGASLVLVLPAPSYDAWAWLLWGAEVASGDLSTVDGPAFKPLPVAVCSLLAGLGAAAPWVWVLIARAAAAMAAWLAFRLARRLAGGSVVAGGLAGVGVLLCGEYLAYASEGVAEGMLLALALAAVEACRAGRPRWALAAAVACGLLRVETWPFLAVAAVATWRRRTQDRWLLATAALLVPAAWFFPELIGSGDILRSADRARVPNPGHPALAGVPLLASLRAGAALPLWPLWAGVGVLAWGASVRRQEAARSALVPAAVGVAWIALVAAMAQVGFSGEPRYALPGAALVASSGAVGLVVAGRRLLRWRGAALPAMGLLVLAAAGPRAGSLVDLRGAQAHQWALQSDLVRAVDEVGGAERVLGCGVPYVGPLRGPLAAYRLGVAKHVVEPDAVPQAPGVVFRSRLTPGVSPAPAVPAGFRRVADAGAWQVYSSC
ncbi:MAG: hypothetical protein M3N25_03280 [Actinomycetota bacterium]|nr:hypothetical protein [Actinomycetota bacterium]